MAYAAPGYRFVKRRTYRRKYRPRTMRTAIRRYKTPYKRPVLRRMRNIRTGGFTGIESKFVDLTLAPTAIVTSNVGAELDPVGTDSLSAIAQGDGESERNGRACTVTRLTIRGEVDVAAVGILSPARLIRIAIVQDTQTNGAQFNSEDVYTAAGQFHDSFRNLQFSKRFRVLKDVLITLRPTIGAGDGAANDTGAFTHPFKFDIPLKMQVIHSGSTNVIANVTDNSLHLMAIASSGTATLNYNCRIRFVG